MLQLPRFVAAGTLPLAAALLVAPQPTPVPQEGLQDDLRTLIQGAFLDDAVRGLSVVVAMDGEVLASVGQGIAGCDPERADARTRYAAGGCLDLFLALSAARLAERDALDPDAAVATLLPAFPFPDSGITVRQLLGHTSGLPSLADLPAADVRGASAKEDPEAALLERMGILPLTATPGSCQTYSSGGVLTLGLVLEAVAELDVQALVAREVLGPMGLDSTNFDGPTSAADPEARRYLGAEFFGTELEPLPFGAERLRTTAADLATLATALNSPEWEAEIASLAKPVVVEGRRRPFAHGLVVGDLEDHPFYSFGGSSASCAVQAAIYPDLNLAVAVCASTGEAPVERLERRIARLVYDLPEPGLRDEPLPAEAGTLYVGEYLVGCNSHFVSLHGERLNLAMPEGRTFDLLFQGDHVFVSAVDPDVRLEFEVQGGRATGFFLEERGARSEGKRIQ